MKKIIESLKGGASIQKACDSAGISTVTFWSWRKQEPRIERLVDIIYESRVSNVEDKLYEACLKGDVQAIRFYLKNRRNIDWQETPLIDLSKTYTSVQYSWGKPSAEQNEHSRGEHQESSDSFHASRLSTRISE